MGILDIFDTDWSSSFSWKKLIGAIKIIDMKEGGHMSTEYGGALDAAMLDVEMLDATSGIYILGGLLDATMLDFSMLDGTQGSYPAGDLGSLSGGELDAAMLDAGMLDGLPTY